MSRPSRDTRPPTIDSLTESLNNVSIAPSGAPQTQGERDRGTKSED